MKRLLTSITGLVGSLFMVVGSASAATVLWDRGTEADLSYYRIYACFTPGCIVTKTPAMLLPGSVPQVPVGQVPQYVINLTGETGNLAVTAIDTTGNESGLSVPVGFTATSDTQAPASPVNPRIQ